MVEHMTQTPAPAVWPALIYTDAPAAIRFLVEAFGFVEELVVPGDADRDIAHAELRWPAGGGVMLGSTGDDNEFCQREPGTASTYVVTDAPMRFSTGLPRRGLRSSANSGMRNTDRAGSPCETRKEICGALAPTAGRDALRCPASERSC